MNGYIMMKIFFKKIAWVGGLGIMLVGCVHAMPVHWQALNLKAVDTEEYEEYTEEEKFELITKVKNACENQVQNLKNATTSTLKIMESALKSPARYSPRNSSFSPQKSPLRNSKGSEIVNLSSPENVDFEELRENLKSKIINSTKFILRFVCGLQDCEVNAVIEKILTDSLDSQLHESLVYNESLDEANNQDLL